MKLKTWLLLSYLIVMILPLVTAYLLFAWIQSYHSDQKVAAYFQTSDKLQEIKRALSDPLLYKPKVKRDRVEQLANEQLSIVLYNPNGLVIYTSNPAFISSDFGLGRERLYSDLYTLDQGYRTYSYKQPVFSGQELVGFFQIELARDAWVAGVSNRSLLTFGIFVVLFLLIYIIVVCLVNRKLNRRLTGLQHEMTAFAAGHVMKETRTNNDEIGELKRHFYTMRNQIHTAREVIAKEQREKEYMIATISHDLKTPLTSIKAYAESLESEKGLTVTEQNEYKKIIIEKSNFMKQMLDDLLTYTLLQSPAYEMEFVSVDGSEFFDMLISDYEALCKEKHIHLHAYADVTGSFEVNPKQMMRVADNLMSNAVQHTNDGKHIWLASISRIHSPPDWLFDFVWKQITFEFDKYVYLIVQNEGKGIAEGQISRIFDPLYQADQARSKKGDHGTGLGLSITKQIIDKHGGNIRILSKEEIGACVICRLPTGSKEGDKCESY